MLTVNFLPYADIVKVKQCLLGCLKYREKETHWIPQIAGGEILDKVMSHKQWHIRVHERHLMFKGPMQLNYNY